MYNQEETTKKLNKFRDDRNWGKDHLPEELARSLMIEAAELNRIFQWPTMNRPIDRVNLAEELADILIYTTMLCGDYGFDMQEIVDDKISMNGIRYPKP